VTTAAAARKAVAMAAQMFGLIEPTAAGGGAAPAAPAAAGHVVNQLAVATPNQINLRVRIAEVSSTALKELGITLSKSTGKFQFSTTNPTLLTPPTQNAFQLIQPLGSGQDLTVVLDALTSEGLATNLAEPNLTALSGEKASFLVGGEIQIPGALTPATAVTGSTSVSTSTTASTQPLSFGVRLDFTATILDANHINLKLRPEISALDNTDATTINGTTIPGLDETIAETTIELASGQSFALAGLLQHNINQTISKVPGLGDIPVVGALFRTTTFNKTDTEVVIVVTPYIVKPVATALATPADGFEAPHDLSRVLLGSTYRQTLPAPPTGPVGPGGQGLLGPAGFRLD
jgi:pilus assembly protein CpaC